MFYKIFIQKKKKLDRANSVFFSTIELRENSVVVALKKRSEAKPMGKVQSFLLCTWIVYVFQIFYAFGMYPYPEGKSAFVVVPLPSG